MNHHHASQQLPNHMNHQSSHLNPTAALLNQSLNNTNALGGHHQGLPMQLPPPAGMYDLHHNMGMNGLNSNMQKVPSAEQFVYMGQHGPQPPQHLAQNQYLPRNNVNVNVNVSTFFYFYGKNFSQGIHFPEPKVLEVNLFNDMVIDQKRIIFSV